MGSQTAPPFGDDQIPMNPPPNIWIVPKPRLTGAAFSTLQPCCLFYWTYAFVLSHVRLHHPANKVNVTQRKAYCSSTSSTRGASHICDLSYICAMRCPFPPREHYWPFINWTPALLEGGPLDFAGDSTAFRGSNEQSRAEHNLVPRPRINIRRVGISEEV